MKCAIGFEAGLDAGVVTGVIVALYGVVMSALKRLTASKKKGRLTTPLFYCRGKKSSANLPRNQKQP